MTPIKSALLQKFNLTPRQLDVAELAYDGKTNKEIASIMFVGEKTAKFHMGLIFKKCKCKNRLELAVIISKLVCKVEPNA